MATPAARPMRRLMPAFDVAAIGDLPSQVDEDGILL